MLSNGDITQCNLENCKQCGNKHSCARYIDYLEEIVDSLDPSASSIQDVTLSGPIGEKTDLNPILIALSENSNKVMGINGNINDLMLELGNSKTQALSQHQELNAKLDSIINVFRRFGTPDVSAELNKDADNNPLPENGLAVYDGFPLQKGDTYLEEKKTLFGGTKVVERTVK